MKLNLNVAEKTSNHQGLIFYQELVEEIHSYLLTKSGRLIKENISEEWDNIFEKPQFHIYKDVKHFKKIDRIYTFDKGPITIKSETSEVWGPGLRNKIKNIEIDHFETYTPHISVHYSDTNSNINLDFKIKYQVDLEIKGAILEIVNKSALAKEY